LPSSCSCQILPSAVVLNRIRAIGVLPQPGVHPLVQTTPQDQCPPSPNSTTLGHYRRTVSSYLRPNFLPFPHFACAHPSAHAHVPYRTVLESNVLLGASIFYHAMVRLDRVAAITAPKSENTASAQRPRVSSKERHILCTT
jgi:hypothetical protein